MIELKLQGSVQYISKRYYEVLCKTEKNNVQLLVVGFDDDNGFFLGNGYSCSYTGLFLDYVFVNDGSPCGELLEEK